MKEIYINYHTNSISFNDVNRLSTQKNIIVLDTTDNNDLLSMYPILNNAKFIKILDKKKKYRLIKQDELIFININKNTTAKQFSNIISILKKSKVFISKNSFIGWISEELSTDLYNDFIYSLIALTYTNLQSQYNYIYDIVCDKLDNEFKTKNFCDFKNDQCIANREHKSANEIMGCCYSFQYSKSLLRFTENEHLCNYLNDKTCTIKCISCKLFTCKYLREKGIKFDTKNIFIINTFFNRKQQETLSKNFFLPKEKIIEKLILDLQNKQPYPIFYIKDSALIR